MFYFYTNRVSSDMHDVVFDVFARGNLCVCGGACGDDCMDGSERENMEGAKSVGDGGGGVCVGAGGAGGDGGA